MIKLHMSVHTTVSPAPLTAVGQPHVVRKGAELSVTIALNDGLPLPHALELLAELVLEDGTAIVAPTDEGLTALSSVTRYMLQPGKVTALLRPRINLLSSAFDGADTPFRIRVRAINEPSIESVSSARLVVRSKWPMKSKREARMSATIEGAPPPPCLDVPHPSAALPPGDSDQRASAPTRQSASDSASGATSHESGEASHARRSSSSRSASTSEGRGAAMLAGMADIIHALDGPETRGADGALAAAAEQRALLGADADDVLEGMLNAEEIEDMLQLLADESTLIPANAHMATAPLIATLASAYESRAPPPPPTLQPPPSHAARASVTGIMPNRQRVRTMVIEGDGSTSAIDALDHALEDGRRKRRPLAHAHPQMATGLGAPRGALPAWLDRVSLCKASGFICMEIVYAEPAVFHADRFGAAPHGSMRVRWCSANMNSTVGIPLDRLLGGAELRTLFSADSQPAVSRVATECVLSRTRLALDCGAVGLSLDLVDGRRFGATCHLMMHTDGVPEGSLTLRRAIVLARVHSFALGGNQLLTFEHPRACDVPPEDGDVVRRLFGGRVHYASPSTIDMFGFDAWQFVGREAGCSLHPDDAGRWFAFKLEVGRALQANMGVWSEHSFTHRHIHCSKGYVWVHCVSQSRLMQLPARLMQLTALSSVHDSLACALQEVIVRVRLAEAAPDSAPAPPASLDLDESAEPQF